MDIAPPASRPIRESIVPMINVVFLLLVFFLLTSHITPPDPAEVTAPDSSAATDPTATVRLFVDAKGQLYHETTTGEAALTAALASGDDARVLLTADRAAEAAGIAALLRRLASAGARNVELVVTPK